METNKRCNVCNKKQLLPVTCECGKFFCITHRYHECEAQKRKDLDNLKRNLQSAVPSKLVEKI